MRDEDALFDDHRLPQDRLLTWLGSPFAPCVAGQGRSLRSSPRHPHQSHRQRLIEVTKSLESQESIPLDPISTRERFSHRSFVPSQRGQIYLWPRQDTQQPPAHSLKNDSGNYIVEEISAKC
jgi:hypothetical protein